MGEEGVLLALNDGIANGIVCMPLDVMVPVVDALPRLVIR